MTDGCMVLEGDGLKYKIWFYRIDLKPVMGKGLEIMKTRTFVAKATLLVVHL